MCFYFYCLGLKPRVNLFWFSNLLEVTCRESWCFYVFQDNDKSRISFAFITGRKSDLQRSSGYVSWSGTRLQIGAAPLGYLWQPADQPVGLHQVLNQQEELVNAMSIVLKTSASCVYKKCTLRWYFRRYFRVNIFSRSRFY